MVADSRLGLGKLAWLSCFWPLLCLRLMRLNGTFAILIKNLVLAGFRTVGFRDPFNMVSLLRSRLALFILGIIGTYLRVNAASAGVKPPPPFEVTAAPRAHQPRDNIQPPALCGFVDYSISWACGPQSTCFYNTDISGVGCCNTLSSCDYATSCVPFSLIAGAPTPTANVLFW